MIYLDANATMPMKPAVRVAVVEAMERCGRPSSIHRYGRIARRYVEDARAAVAALVGAKPSEVIFTSGGSDANRLILNNFSSRIASAVEHKSILAFANPEMRLPVTRSGLVNIEAAKSLLRCAPAGSLVSVMAVNNETGIINSTSRLASLAKKYGHVFHTDAVQAIGRHPVDFAVMGIDALTISAHKIGGPQGVGALVVKDSVYLKSLHERRRGERGFSDTTDNVAAIVGFGLAAQLAVDDLRDAVRLSALRDMLERKLAAIGGGDVVVIGQDAPRIGNTLSIALRGVSSEVQAAAMDSAGVAVGTGSARGQRKSSHVLEAMGYESDVAECALRISLGWHTKDRDIDRCVEAWRGLYARLNVLRKTKAA